MERQIRKMTLTWTFNGQPNTTPSNLAFIFKHLQCSLPRFARFITPHSSLPLGPAHSWGGRCWSCWHLADYLSVQSWCPIPRAQVSGAHLATHSSFKQSRSVVLGLMCCFTNTRNHVNVFCTFSGRAVVESPIIPPHQTMPRVQAVGLSTRIASKLSNKVNFSCSVELMIHLNCLFYIVRQWSFNLHCIWEEWVIV